MNDVRLDNVTHEEAVMAFRTTDATISLLVEKGAEMRVLVIKMLSIQCTILIFYIILTFEFFGNKDEEPPPLSPRHAQPSEVDGPTFDESEPRDSSLQGTVMSFFRTTLGGLTLGIMAGSLTVFVGTRIYKALTK